MDYDHPALNLLSEIYGIQNPKSTNRGRNPGVVMTRFLETEKMK